MLGPVQPPVKNNGTRHLGKRYCSYSKVACFCACSSNNFPLHTQPAPSLPARLTASHLIWNVVCLQEPSAPLTHEAQLRQSYSYPAHPLLADSAHLAPAADKSGVTQGPTSASAPSASFLEDVHTSRSSPAKRASCLWFFSAKQLECVLLLSDRYLLSRRAGISITC